MMVDRLTSGALTGWNGVVANEIVSRLRGVARAGLEDTYLQERTWPLARISQDTKVLSVWGGRGTGKSSILTSVARRLIDQPSDAFLVLGPIQPELFGPSDSILNVALAELRQAVEALAVRGQDVTSDSIAYREVLGTLERAQLTAAVSQTTIQMISNAAATVDEFGRQLQRVAGATSDLWRRLAAATARVATTYGHIVVIIDDPDLAPIQTSEAFRDIRNLGSLPGVALLLGANRENTRRVIAHGHVRQQPEIDQDQRWRWPHVDAEVISFEEKVFPRSLSFTTSAPTPAERVSFARLGQKACIADLLHDCAEYTPDCPGLLERVLIHGDPVRPDSLTTASPLPERYRALAQLWDHLEEMGRINSVDGLEPAQRATAVSHLCETLLSQLQQPRGIANPMTMTWGPMVSTRHGDRRRVNLKLTSLMPDVSAAGGFRDPDTASAEDKDRGVHLQLREIAVIGNSPTWARSNDYPKSSFNGEASGDELATLLALQEILWDSELFGLDDESAMGGGLRPPEYSFLQVVRFEGQQTDDYLVTLPNIKVWSSLELTGRAWNGIVGRWRTEGLSTRSVLALTLRAASSICAGKEFMIDAASTDYRTALHGLEAQIRQLKPDEPTSLMEQELINWYIGFVPAHWHLSIFDQKDIDTFLYAWSVIYPEYSSSHRASRMQRAWSLAFRTRRLIDEATDAGRALRYAWIGGYERVLTAMGLDLHRVSLDRVLRAWTERLNARLIGAVATQDADGGSDSLRHAPSPGDAEGSKNRPRARTVGEGKASLATRTVSSGDAETFGEGLMQAALLAIDRWQGHEQ